MRQLRIDGRNAGSVCLGFVSRAHSAVKGLGRGVHRTPSPRNPFQKKTRVEIKRQQKGDIVYLLCRSEGREEKDRAIREKQETKLIADLNRLQQRVAKGRLKRENKIQRAIGRLLERYPRVARYYELSYDAVQKNLSWNELTDKKANAKKLDGSYVLNTLGKCFLDFSGFASTNPETRFR